MNILLTNDDGIGAKGIRSLAKILSRFGNVTVIAPKYHQSGMSTAVSFGLKQLAYKEVGERDGVIWSYLDATPASCVKFGFHILPQMPDIVVSGINHGSNASTAASYSGTLGAAIEAAIRGIPAIGVSLDSMIVDADFSAVEKHFPLIFEKLTSNLSNRFGIYYNVNFPNLPASEIKGVKVAKMGRGYWHKEFTDWNPDIWIKRGVSPEIFGGLSKAELEPGEKLYMMVGEYVDTETRPEGDSHIMEQGYISVTAHNIDSTDNKEYARLGECGLNMDF